MAVTDIYEFKSVSADDLNKLISFIDKHWKKNHALVLSNNLLNFQHLDKNKDFYHFLVAENLKTKEFDALIGYIPTFQYDISLNNQGDYWGAIWKKREDVDIPEINIAGLQVWLKLLKLEGFQSYSAIGISDIAKKLYLAYHLKVGFLNHYYILNDQINDFKIAANVKKGSAYKLEHDTRYIVKWLDKIDDIKLNHSYRPLKTIPYLINRYEKHPLYNYRFLGVFEDSLIVTILVTRTIEQNGSKVIRIIDAYGEIKGSLRHQLKEILYTEDAEYIDMLNYGINPQIIKKAGFEILDFDGDLIIPSYFEPFERRNVKIELAYKADYDYVAFKGDGDQDRPNIL